MRHEEVFAPLGLQGTRREDLAAGREGEGTSREEQATRLEEQGTPFEEPFEWLAAAYATREAAVPSPAPRSRWAWRKVSLSLNTLAIFIPLRTAPSETLPVARARPRPK